MRQTCCCPTEQNFARGHRGPEQVLLPGNPLQERMGHSRGGEARGISGALPPGSAQPSAFPTLPSALRCALLKFCLLSGTGSCFQELHNNPTKLSEPELIRVFADLTLFFGGIFPINNPIASSALLALPCATRNTDLKPASSPGHSVPHFNVFS